MITWHLKLLGATSISGVAPFFRWHPHEFHTPLNILSGFAQVVTAEAERIFDEFVQLNEYYDGTGIGLTVARSLARRLGGDVVLDTTYTAGARFVFTLPW